MLWAVICTDKPDTKALRDEYLDVHREFLTEREGQIFFSGPLQSDDASHNHGSLFILNVPDRAAAEEFAASEPFNRQGVFASVKVSRIRKGRFHADLAD